MYARTVTLYIKPDKIDDMGAFFQNKLLKIITRQPGFKGMFVLKRPEENKEVCITLWENMIDLESFNISYSILKEEIVPLLSSVPEVEIFQVVVPEEARPADIVAFSESSLGIRIIDPTNTNFNEFEEMAVQVD